MLRPIWTNRIQIYVLCQSIWIKIIQAFQSITLRLRTSTSRYVSNNSLNNDLKIKTINRSWILPLNKFFFKLITYSMVSPIHGGVNLLKNLLRWLKRHLCRDLFNLLPNATRRLLHWTSYLIILNNHVNIFHINILFAYFIHILKILL